MRTSSCLGNFRPPQLLLINFKSLLIGFFCAEELVAGLSRVSWEKVDVSFHASRQRFAAHSVIQVSLILPSCMHPFVLTAVLCFLVIWYENANHLLGIIMVSSVLMCKEKKKKTPRKMKINTIIFCVSEGT